MLDKSPVIRHNSCLIKKATLIFILYVMMMMMVEVVVVGVDRVA